MANRFLETNYYKSPFVRSLKGSLKGLYSFIICDCTPSGIWSLDIQAAELYIGFSVTIEEFEESFVKKGKAVDLGNGKYFFPDFIEHQYPKGLQDNNAAHKNIIFELKKFDLIDDKNAIKVKKIKGSLKELDSPYGIGNGIGNGNGSIGEHQGNLLCPTMLKIFKKNISFYVEDVGRDFQPLLSIGQIIFTHFGMSGDLLANTKKICNEWDLICIWIKDDPFYSQKSLKTISNHIQEIITKSKNGSLVEKKGLSAYEKQVQENNAKASKVNY